MHEDLYENCEFCGRHCPGWTTVTADPAGDPNVARWICTDCWIERKEISNGTTQAPTNSESQEQHSQTA